MSVNLFVLSTLRSLPLFFLLLVRNLMLAYIVMMLMKLTLESLITLELPVTWLDYGCDGFLVFLLYFSDTFLMFFCKLLNFIKEMPAKKTNYK